MIAEDTITDPADHALIRRLFADRPPLTTRGHIRYAEALFEIDQDERGEALIRKAWVEGDFSAREEQRFLQKYRRLLTPRRITSRASTICCGTIAARSANRMLAAGARRLPAARRGADAPAAAPGRGRRGDRGGAGGACATIPGLIFDRMRWRRQKRLDNGVIEILLDPPEAARAGRSCWWFERELQIRRALRKRDFDLAYRLASQPSPDRGRRLRRGGVAGRLAGAAFRRSSRTPRCAISRGCTTACGRRSIAARAAYWAGRSAAALGDPALAGQWYRSGGGHADRLLRPAGGGGARAKRASRCPIRRRRIRRAARGVRAPGAGARRAHADRGGCHRSS